MSVVMGSAKLTVGNNSTVMFAQDRNDRVLVWFTASDATLNDVSRVEIKDAKYQDMFRIIDYKNGLYAVAYQGGKVHSSLIGKKDTMKVTLNLNVFLEGNESTKANTTAKLALTVIK